MLDQHPEAKKKDVARAAYRLMIEAADSDAAPALQDVAITLRAADWQPDGLGVAALGWPSRRHLDLPAD